MTFEVPDHVILPTVPKVMCYVFNGSVDRVLTFRQPNAPQAGLQVPAGTVERGEFASEAAARELREETGIDTQIRLYHFANSIADVSRYKPELHERSWHFGIAADFPAGAWKYEEPVAGRDVGIVAEFAWTDLREAEQELVAGHGDLLTLAAGLAAKWFK